MTLNTGLFCLVVVGLAYSQVRADCSPSFFAKDIKYEEAVEIDFYYTGINLESTKACASFCAQREFCRSAVYNPRTKTCGISYDYTIACGTGLEKVSSYELKEKNSGNLIHIACVDSCKKGVGADKNKKVPIGIITGDPHDGESSPSPKAPENKNANAITEGKPLKTTEKPRAEGYVTRLILANITGLQEGGVGSIEPLTLQQNDEKASEQTKNRGKSQVCYRTIRHRYLLGAIFEEHDVKSINECRCLCAATYRDADAKNRCQSFQYKAGKCEINKGNHLGKYDLIERRKSVYQYVDCDIDVLLDVASNFCPNFKITTVDITSTQQPSTTTTKKAKVELITGKPLPEKPTKKNSDKKTTEKPKKETDKPKALEKTTVKPTVTKPTTTKPTTEATTEATTEVSTEASTETTTEAVTESSTEPSTEATSPTTSPVPVKKNRPTGNDVVEEKTDELVIKKDGCFEVIDDHLMVSVAGGLEHDASIEECKCICANSKSSGKYEFQCTSATYYHVERDCILNLEDRVMKSKLFEKQFTNFNVSYIGITCPIEKALESTKDLSSTSCRRALPASEESEGSSTSAPKKRKNGENSDSCFVELHDFVLEGTAIAVETGATPNECKCKCAEGQKLYGEDCASFLYYYDSKTCLINKQNRFSNPEKFNFVPSVNQSRSYFEWTCATKHEDRAKYLTDVCNVATEKVEGNLLNSEDDAEVVKLDAQKVVDNDVVRLKRLDEKEFLQKLEEVVDERIKLKQKESEEEENEKSTKENEKNGKDEKVVKMKTVDTDEIIKKIEEASASLATSTTSTTTETPSTTTTEEATTTTATVDSNSSSSTTTEKTIEQAKEDKEVKLIKVDQAELMDRINEAVEKLESSTTTTDTPSTTTTSKLILNPKKGQNKSEPGKKGNKKDGQVQLKTLDDKEFDKLLKQKVVDEKTIDPIEGQEKLNTDPKNVPLKRVDPEVLEEISKMKIVEGVVIPEYKSTSSSSSSLLSTSAEKHSTSKPTKKYSIPEAEGIEEEDVEDDVVEAISSELHDEPAVQETSTSTTPTAAPSTTPTAATSKVKASGVKTHKFDEKVDKEGMPLPLLTTTLPTTTTTLGYPSAGRCSYSALYQTAFLGRRLLKTVRVKTPADCFAACFALRCRSANLIAQGELHSCELYRDSLIDYRRPDMIGYDAATVYFDGINCDGSQ